MLTNAGTEGRIKYAGYFTTKHSLTSERPVTTAACSPRSETDLSDQTRAETRAVWTGPHVCSLGQVDILAKDVLQSSEVVEKDAAALALIRGPSLLPWPPPDGPFPAYR